MKKLLFSFTFGALVASFSFGDSLLLEASDFNVFVGHGFTGLNSDVQGRVAAGGNFSVQNYGIGDHLTGFTGNSLLVGGEFSYTNGQVFNGSVLTADSTPSTSGLNILNGTMHSGSALDIYIPTLMTELIARSGYVGSLSATATTNLSFGTLTLSGGSGTTRFYTVSASQLASATSVVVDAPAGTTAVINVNGANASFQNAGYSLTGGITADHVLLNFWNAQTLSMSGVGVSGSIFAPQADVSFANGQLNGQLIANSFNGSGEIHIGQFGGNVPVPEPATLAVLAIGGLGLLARRRK